MALCKPDNRAKCHHFRDGCLRFYRGERITERISVRFKAGRLWPRVNGRVRDETRTEWDPDR